MDYTKPRFTLRQAAKASDFAYNSMRAYFQREWFRSFAKGIGKGRGRTGLLCITDVIILTIANRLTLLGMNPAAAFQCASIFFLVTKTHRDGPKRKPSCLFNMNRFITMFIWSPGKIAQVIPVSRDHDSLPLSELMFEETDGWPAVIINLTDLVKYMFHELGIEDELSEMDDEPR